MYKNESVREKKISEHHGTTTSPAPSPLQRRAGHSGGSNTSSVRGRKAINDVVNGDRIERRRWCSRLRVNPPRGEDKGKRKDRGRLISKVPIVHRFKFTTKTQPQPFPNHDTYAGVFRQAPGRTSFPRPG